MDEAQANADPRSLIEDLAHPKADVWFPAYQALDGLGAEAIPAIREGLGDGRWRVRRWCAALLDHGGGPETRPWLVPLLQDPMSKVRLWAVHTLACDRCAGGENPVDVVPHLIERIRHDESIRVRRMALCMLAQQVPDERIAPVCLEILENETDKKLLHHARTGLERHE